MATPNPSGTTTEPQQITVEQLAAQLSKKASPASGGGSAASPADPEARPAEEAPAGGAPGTEPDLFQSASINDGTDGGAPAGEAASATPSGQPGEGGDDTEPAAPEWYQKRIAKITAKQKALEQRLQAAEQRAEEAAAELDKARRNGGGKTAKAWNHQEQTIQQELTQKRELLRWAEENADGATVPDGKGNEVTYSPDQVRAIKLSALEDIGDLRGRLREHQAGLTQMREQWDADAVKAYPDLKDPNSELSRNVETVLDKLPWLREVPDARMSMADMFAGRAARLKKGGSATAQPAAAPKAAPRAPGTASAAPARTPEGEPSQEAKQANETFFQTGRTSDLARRFSLERKV